MSSMRLQKIKLAGFKSFVDPMILDLKSNLVGVVGPNGCGKSNVIDAVRWVMGESSAKNLRGGQATDVIFNGSAARKPVGQATVELLFENTEGKFGGEYAAYNEIAIKRQVTRDGQSHYFLNGQRCRRKDITDIFLGTGLGPRSYSIIEQGMISRVIEAKPEELRIFLEEAAGISKYKERRRETENRIRHTQDNLDRLNDLKNELEKQLQHLSRQSQTAQRYKALQEEQQTYSAQLAALSWKRIDSDLKEYEAKVREAAVFLEEQQADFQHLKTSQEKKRLEQAQAHDALNEVQKRYYSEGADIAKLEQTISHHHERHEQLLNDKAQANETLATSERLLEESEAAFLTLQIQLEQIEPLYEELSMRLSEAQERAEEAEFALEEWREQSAKLQEKALQPSKQAEAEKAKITQLERQIQQISERQGRLQAKKLELKSEDASSLAIFEEKIAIYEQQAEEVALKLVTLSQEKTTVGEHISALRLAIKNQQQKVHEIHNQLAALKALQQAALGKDQAAKQAWLKTQGLDEKHFLVEKLSVEKGWENAVETVLGEFIDALTVDEAEFSKIRERLSSLQGIGLSVVTQTKQDQNSLVNSNNPTLVQTIQGSDWLPHDIRHLLSTVRACADLETALSMLPSLQKGESVITQEGWWLTQSWLKVKAKNQNQEEGILAREEKLKQLNHQSEIETEKLEALQIELDGEEDKLNQLNAENVTFTQEKSKIQQELTAVQSELKINKNRLQQNEQAFNQVQHELLESEGLLAEMQKEINVARQNLQTALEQMATFTEQQEISAAQKNQLQENLLTSRERAKEAKENLHATELKRQTFKTQSVSLQENINRFKQQIESAVLRVRNVEEALEKNSAPVLELKEILEEKVSARLTTEDALNDARDLVAEIDNILRNIEEQLSQHERKISNYREQLEQNKLQLQALSVHRENAIEKLSKTNYTLEQILETLPSDASEDKWIQELLSIDNKIQKLGAINLAAIEEFEAAKQRFEYLESQYSDLTEALTTLEDAIKKIDKETRLKFKETFDKVNTEFMRLFPALFGGGHASLSMTGEDLLDTGITLMARPPGKKNSTITQLSGGEKALTAVALVFGIFQLNPAPFCMLDEVDAPLDDTNVGRFCNLVKEMSKTVQFIYVSHNKVTIEMAEQLQGVTMREPGVSRLVTVDMTQAQSLIDA